MKSANIVSIGSKVLAKLEDHPKFIDLMAAAIIDGLEAKVTVFKKGDSEGIDKADGRTRLEAFKLAMAYAEGLPLQRIIEARIDGGIVGGDLEKLLASSPRLVAQLERALDGHKKTAAPKRVGPGASK